LIFPRGQAQITKQFVVFIAIAPTAAPGIGFAMSLINKGMEKRILGVILAIIGVIGLILAAVGFANGGSSGRGIRMIVIYSILGVIFFFSGISLVKNTKDKAT